jgi:hypothetical protein
MEGSTCTIYDHDTANPIPPHKLTPTTHTTPLHAYPTLNCVIIHRISCAANSDELLPAPPFRTKPYRYGSDYAPPPPGGLGEGRLVIHSMLWSRIFTVFDIAMVM